MFRLGIQKPNAATGGQTLPRKVSKVCQFLRAIWPRPLTTILLLLIGSELVRQMNQMILMHPCQMKFLFYSILFYSILFYSILFYSILFYSILFYYFFVELYSFNFGPKHSLESSLHLQRKSESSPSSYSTVPSLKLSLLACIQWMNLSTCCSTYMYAHFRHFNIIILGIYVLKVGWK